jgi:hypothetical protein
MRADQVSALGDWNNVLSVQLTLWFNNPLYVAGGTGQAQYISFQRNVAIMSTTGI